MYSALLKIQFLDHSCKISNLKIAPRLKKALPTLIQRFLYLQLNEGANDSDDIDLDDCPLFYGNVGVYLSAKAVFYAPSELSGPGGMHAELIRSSPLWFTEKERRDTVLVQNGEETERMGGMIVARVLTFLAFRYESKQYTCALVEWFLPCDDKPDPITGMWILQPEIQNRSERTLGLIHTDCIVRACHLIPVYGRSCLPADFNYSNSLRAFKSYYLNKYAGTRAC
jgi:hypothetical protein